MEPRAGLWPAARFFRPRAKLWPFASPVGRAARLSRAVAASHPSIQPTPPAAHHERQRRRYMAKLAGQGSARQTLACGPYLRVARQTLAFCPPCGPRGAATLRSSHPAPLRTSNPSCCLPQGAAAARGRDVGRPWSNAPDFGSRTLSLGRAPSAPGLFGDIGRRGGNKLFGNRPCLVAGYGEARQTLGPGPFFWAARPGPAAH